MTIDEFVAANNGKFIDVDHYYGAQCWDLVELYAEQVLGIPKEPWAITLGPEGAAKEAWKVFDAHMQRYFDKIPKGQEQKGDIPVYDGHGAFPEGHIAISLGGGQVFEENADPNGSPAHVYPRATTYLLGSLRKKGSGVMNFEEGNRLDFISETHGLNDRTKNFYKQFVGMPYRDAWYQIKNTFEYRNEQFFNVGDFVNNVGREPTAEEKKGFGFLQDNTSHMPHKDAMYKLVAMGLLSTIKNFVPVTEQLFRPAS